MTTTELDLELVLPGIQAKGDRCGERLASMISHRDGIERAHVRLGETSNTDKASLCVHYDPAVIGLERIRELVRTAGGELRSRYDHFVFEIASGRPNSQRRIENEVREVRGVVEAEASETGRLRVELDNEKGDADELRATAMRLGARDLERGTQTPESSASDSDARSAGAKDHAEHEHEHGRLETVLEIGAAAVGAVAWVTAFIVGQLDAAPDVVRWLLYSVYATTGVFVLRDTLQSWLARRLEIDSLMIAAAVGAAILGSWSEGALLLVLFAIGHALERYAMQRAKRAIEALGELAPENAIVVRDGVEETVPAAELVVGDRVRVRAHERIPADGIVASGSGAVNEAPITGESVPVDKEPADSPESLLESWSDTSREHRVFAGTINDVTSLDVLVARPAGASTLARLVTMVSEAETQKSPTQRFTDRFERVFVPAVLVLAGLLFFAWLVIDESFAESAYRALAVLVAASPCALAIATPSAVLSAVARAGQRGVLVKGGGPLESLGRVSTIAFDKTGTLTKGEPSVTDIEPAPGMAASKLASIALSLEATSDHPLARAITRDLASKGESRGVIVDRAIVGRGLTGMIDGAAAWVGSRKLFGEPGAPPIPTAVTEIADALEAQGRTIVIVGHGESVMGVLGIMDEARPQAKAAIVALRAAGIESFVMLSGDNPSAARAIGETVGVSDARGGLLPEDKVAAIEALRQEGGVAMVGDGVNDAPAMATASVGIAMGAAGSDVALETADVALMGDDLSQLRFAISLSRKSASIIRQNLLLSLGVVAALIPATILGVGIGPAVIAHEGSTLVVVANALRLLRHR